MQSLLIARGESGKSIRALVALLSGRSPSPCGSAEAALG